jgi:hypothetical protein
MAEVRLVTRTGYKEAVTEPSARRFFSVQHLDELLAAAGEPKEALLHYLYGSSNYATDSHSSREDLDPIMRAPQCGHGQGAHARRVRLSGCFLRFDGRRVSTEQCAGRSDAVGAVGAGQETIVADAMEALGQPMQQEAPDELVRKKPIVFQRAGPSAR